MKQRRITSRGRSSGRGPRPERAFDRGAARRPRNRVFFNCFFRRHQDRKWEKIPDRSIRAQPAAAPPSSARSPSPTVRRVRASKRRRPARFRAPLRPAPRTRPVVPPRIARPSAPSPLSIPRARGARPAHRSRASPSRARGIPSFSGKLVAPIRGSPLDLGLARDGGRPHPLPGQGAQVQACVHRPPREKSRPRAATSRPRAAPRDARSRAHARARASSRSRPSSWRAPRKQETPGELLARISRPSSKPRVGRVPSPASPPRAHPSRSVLNPPPSYSRAP